MQQVDPMFTLKKQLKGTWKSESPLCVAVLDENSNITVDYDGAHLGSTYSVYTVNPAEYQNPNPLFMGMMGMGADDAFKCHTGETMKIIINDRTFYKEEQTVYRVSASWYGLGALNLEIMDLNDGHIETVKLTREEESKPVIPDGELQCECGYIGMMGKFCPQCGRPSPSYDPSKASAAAQAPEQPPRVLNEDEKFAIVEHGWRTEDGSLQILLKDRSLLLLTSDGKWLDTTYNVTLNPEPGLGASVPERDDSSYFKLYPKTLQLRLGNKKVMTLYKLWYEDNALHALIRDGSTETTSDLIIDDTIVSLTLPKPEPVGWTCSNCGKTSQIGKFCSECGSEIKKQILFDYFEQTLGTPMKMPYHEIVVYEHTADQVIIEEYTNGGMPGEEVERILASSDIIAKGEEIIARHNMRSWNESGRPSGMCGGIKVIKFKDVDGLIRVSTDKMLGNGFEAFNEMSSLLSSYLR